jgi:hypothetical protein
MIHTVHAGGIALLEACIEFFYELFIPLHTFPRFVLINIVYF